MDFVFFSIINKTTLDKLKSENKGLEYSFTFAIQQLDAEREKLALLQKVVDAQKNMLRAFSKKTGLISKNNIQLLARTLPGFVSLPLNHFKATGRISTILTSKSPGSHDRLIQ